MIKLCNNFSSVVFCSRIYEILCASYYYCIWCRIESHEFQRILTWYMRWLLVKFLESVWCPVPKDCRAFNVSRILCGHLPLKIVDRQFQQFKLCIEEIQNEMNDPGNHKIKDNCIAPDHCISAIDNDREEQHVPKKSATAQHTCTASHLSLHRILIHITLPKPA